VKRPAARGANVPTLDRRAALAMTAWLLTVITTSLRHREERSDAAVQKKSDDAFRR